MSEKADDHDSKEARLTAYVLGELTPEESAAMEAELAIQPALETERARIASVVLQLKQSLGAGSERHQKAPGRLQLPVEKRRRLLEAFSSSRREKASRWAFFPRLVPSGEVMKVAAMVAALFALSASLMVSFRSSPRYSAPSPVLMDVDALSIPGAATSTGAGGGGVLHESLQQSESRGSSQVQSGRPQALNTYSYPGQIAEKKFDSFGVSGPTPQVSRLEERRSRVGAATVAGTDGGRGGSIESADSTSKFRGFAPPVAAPQGAIQDDLALTADKVQEGEGPDPLRFKMDPRMTARYGLLGRPPGSSESLAKAPKAPAIPARKEVEAEPQLMSRYGLIVKPADASSQSANAPKEPDNLADVKLNFSQVGDAKSELGIQPQSKVRALLESAPEKLKRDDSSRTYWNMQTDQAGSKLAAAEGSIVGGATPLNRSVNLSLADGESDGTKESDEQPARAMLRQSQEGARELAELELGKQIVEQESLGLREEAMPLAVPSLERLAEVPAGTPVFEPQPEKSAEQDPFSTFSLNVSDVSFKLAQASLESGVMPAPESIRSEEFVNAFEYHDPEPRAGKPLGFVWEQARYPFAHRRDVFRFSIKTASAGRSSMRPLNLVLLLDNSGSMERADRVRIRQECLRVLSGQLRPSDTISVIAFARTTRLIVDGLPGDRATELMAMVGDLTPQGGTNLEEALTQAYRQATAYFKRGGMNRVVLLTDGAANLGEADPAALRKQVEAHRKAGVALDCFGIGWDGLNDEFLELLSRNGDGRYGFVNSPEQASADFVSQLAGALQVAASDVKVQVEFNPRRVRAYRQIGYGRHQLTREQFRDNTVDAAEISAAEAGNALYVAEIDPQGEGVIATVRARFKVPGTADYQEHSWPVPYRGPAPALDQAPAALRLAVAAAAFSEWLARSPFANEVQPRELLKQVEAIRPQFPYDSRPQELLKMLTRASAIQGQ